MVSVHPRGMKRRTDGIAGHESRFPSNVARARAKAPLRVFGLALIEKHEKRRSAQRIVLAQSPDGFGCWNFARMRI